MPLRRLLSPLPFTHEIWWSLKALRQKERPFGGRWERLHAWLATVEQRQTEGFRRQPKRKILLFANIPYWVEFCLQLGAVLLEQGCHIHVLWEPQEYLLSATPRGDRYQQWSNWYGQPPAHSCFRFTNVAELPPGEFPEHLSQPLQAFAYCDTQYAERRERIAIDGAHKESFHQRLRALTRFTKRVFPWLAAQAKQLDWLIIPNGNILEFAPMRAMAEELGLPYTTVEVHERKDRIVWAQHRPCIPYDFGDWWREDEPHVLDPERRQRALRRLECREHPGMGDDYVWLGQQTDKRDWQESWQKLALEPSKPTALLCTNIAWDSAVLGLGRVFGTMAEWIAESARWFASRPDWQLIVRTHPAEAHCPSNETTAQILAETFPTLPANIRLVEPGEPINTYSLFGGISFGLVFSSTIGLEMACRGIPVVVCGKVHYDSKGFTRDPRTPREYFEMLAELCASSRPGVLSERQTELALCHFDLYFERASRLPLLSSLGEANPNAIEKLLTACQAPEIAGHVRNLVGLPPR